MKKAIILASVLAIAGLIVLFSILQTKTPQTEENSEDQLVKGTTILVGDIKPLVKRDGFYICKGRSVDMSKAFFRINDSLKKVVIPKNELSLSVVSGKSVVIETNELGFKLKLTASKAKSGNTVIKQCWTTRNLCQQFTVVVPPPDADCSNI